MLQNKLSFFFPLKGGLLAYFCEARLFLCKLEISKKGEFLVNGQSVKLKGVNRHDIHSLYGQYTPEEHMVREFEEWPVINDFMSNR